MICPEPAQLPSGPDESGHAVLLGGNALRFELVDAKAFAFCLHPLLPLSQPDFSSEMLLNQEEDRQDDQPHRSYPDLLADGHTRS